MSSLFRISREAPSRTPEGTRRGDSAEEVDADMEQKHLVEVKGLKEELAEKDDQHAASAEKTRELLKEAESTVATANLDLDTLQAKAKAWQPRLGTINSFLGSESLLFFALC